MPVGTQQRPIQRGESYSLFYATGSDMTGMQRDQRTVVSHQIEEFTAAEDLVVERVDGINGGVNVNVTVLQSGAYPEQAFKRVIHIPGIEDTGDPDDGFGFLESWSLTGSVAGLLVDAREATHRLGGMLEDGLQALLDVPSTVGGAAGTAARDAVGSAIESATGIDFEADTERTVGAVGLIVLTLIVLAVAWKVAT